MSLLIAAPVRADPAAHQIIRHDLFHTLDRACLVEPGDPYQIVAPLDGWLDRQVQDGQNVDAGALLGLYDVAPLERELDLARSRQAVLAARLAQLDGPLTDAQRQLQALDLSATERRVAEAQTAHARLAELAGEGRLAVARLDESHEALRQIEDDLIREQTRQVIFEIETALQITELQNSDREAQAAVAKLDEQLAQSRVTSPVAGQISHVHPGLARAGVAAVQAGVHLFSIAQPDRRWARVGMTAREADRMRFGTVAVIDDAGQVHEAEILQIAMREDATGWDKERFQILVGFDAPDGAFLIGSETICAFRAVAADNIVAAPLQYLSQDGEEIFVLRRVADGVERLEVTTGIVDPPLIEVTSGLAPGDWIMRP